MVASLALGAIVLFGAPRTAQADLLRGLMRIVGGVLAVPQGVLAGTLSGPPIIGTIAGTLSGVLNGVVMVTGGALETVLSAIPLGMKLAPYIPVFL